MVFEMDELLNAFLGGGLIGLAALILMAGMGRIAGISGIVMQAFSAADGRRWRLAFLCGLLAAPWWMRFVLGYDFPIPTIDASPIAVALAGLLVGFGVTLGGGCTSGHGICGLSRLSMRSLIAVLVFMSAAIVTVFFRSQILGN